MEEEPDYMSWYQPVLIVCLLMVKTVVILLKKKQKNGWRSYHEQFEKVQNFFDTIPKLVIRLLSRILRLR